MVSGRRSPAAPPITTWVSPGSPAGRRLSAVAETPDGFVLADMDLKERREGHVLGRNQSGKAVSLRLLSLADIRDDILNRDLVDRTYVAIKRCAVDAQSVPVLREAAATCPTR